MVERSDTPAGEERPREGGDGPDTARVRLALQMLLDRPGALRPEQRGLARQAMIGAKTADVARDVADVLRQRARMMLHRGLQIYLRRKFQTPAAGQPPADVHARLDRALDAVSADAVPGLVPYLEAHDCDVYWADKELDNAMHCYRSTPSESGQELPGMLAPALSEATAALDALFVRLVRGDDAGAARLLQSFAAEPLPSDVEACLRKRRSVYERLLLEQGVTYAQHRREEEWAAAEAEPAATSTQDGAEATQFLKRLAVSCRGKSRDASPFTARFLREGRLLGLPEYDLPIARLLRLSPDRREELERVAAELAKQGGPDAAFHDDLARSLALLRERAAGGEYRYEADPFAVVVARFRKLQPPSSPKKWIDVTEAATARPEAAEAVLDILSYLPEAMFRDVRDPTQVNQTFGKKLSFRRIIALYDAIEEMLRQPRDDKPAGGAVFNDFALLDAQAVILENLLLSERLDKLAVAASVDVRGLFFTLQERGSQGGKADLSFHLPFRLLSDDLLDRLRAKGCLTEGDVEEVRQERAGVQHDREQAADIDRRKEAVAGQRLGVSAGEAGNALAEHLRDPARHMALVQALQPNMQEITRLPQSAAARVVREAMGDPDALKEAIRALLQYAAAIQRRCSRKMGLSDPRNYEAMRAIVMPMLRELATDYRAKQKCGLLWCYVNRPRRRQLLALWPEGDDSTAVLIDLDKFPEDHAQLAKDYAEGGPARNLADFGSGPWGS